MPNVTRRSSIVFRGLLGFAALAAIGAPALAQWLGSERATPVARIIMEADFVAESDIATSFPAAPEYKPEN